MWRQLLKRPCHAKAADHVFQWSDPFATALVNTAEDKQEEEAAASIAAVDEIHMDAVVSTVLSGVDGV